MIVTYSVIVVISIGASIVESRCRISGNVNGALSARRFGRVFILVTGGIITASLIQSWIALLH